MAKVSDNGRNDEQMELPPGFRFHPSDDELITYFLYPKVVDSSFCARAIGEVDLNKVEPWDLPWKAKMGEREWYFFCVRDRKYPSGLRTNRATESGYWKVTGKGKDIFKGKSLIGMKKSLVFYKGRAPCGEKTNWVMHEYRLDGKYSTNKQPKTTKNDWVICRIFFKNSCGKKTHISNLLPTSNYDHESLGLPPLMDLSHNNHRSKTTAETFHVTCFSQPVEDQKSQKSMIESSQPPLIASSSSTNPFFYANSSFFFPEVSAPTPDFANQFESYMGNILFTEPALIREQSIVKFLQENDGQNMNNNNLKIELSQDTTTSTDISSAVSNHEVGHRFPKDQDYLITSAGNLERDSIWNYLT